MPTLEFIAEIAIQKEKIEKLEDMLFKLNAMKDAPCFCCGYNGPNYFQPSVHPCAERHHRLTQK